MRVATFVAGAVLALAMSTGSSGAIAAPSLPELSVQQTLIQPAQYWRGNRWGGWRRCGYWRRECAYRWGWGGRGFRRCMWRHGC
jgi:hypothetical protein